MSKCETVTVECKASERGYKIINKSDMTADDKIYKAPAKKTPAKAAS